MRLDGVDDDDLCLLEVVLPGHGLFKGGVTREPDGALVLETEEFRVDTKHNAGTGTHIMMGALALAKQRGIVHTRAHVDSPAALRIRQNLFGEQMEISDIRIDTPPIPITVTQAIQTLQRQRDLVNAGQEVDTGLLVTSSLAGIDTSAWELPHELNQPPCEF